MSLSKLDKSFDDFQREIIHKKRAISNLFKSTKIIGAYLEDVIREHTRSMIPKKYSVYRGVIVDENNEDIIRSSGELDLIIVDSNKCFPLYSVSDIIITNHKCVKLVAQIKSRLDSTSLESAKQNLSTVKALSNISTVLISIECNYSETKLKDFKKMNEFDEVISFCSYTNPNNVFLNQYKNYIKFLRNNL